MKILVLCQDNRPKHANPYVNYFPVSLEFAGKFANAFCKALLIEDAHTIAFGRDFGKDETNCFIFNRINEHRRTMFKNNGADWVFSLHPVVISSDTSERELVLITRPQHVSADDAKKVINMLRLAIPDASTRLMISLEEITDMYNRRIDDLLDENLDLRLKVSTLKKELSLKAKEDTDDACNN